MVEPYGCQHPGAIRSERWATSAAVRQGHSHAQRQRLEADGSPEELGVLVEAVHAQLEAIGSGLPRPIDGRPNEGAPDAEASVLLGDHHRVDVGNGGGTEYRDALRSSQEGEQ